MALWPLATLESGCYLHYRRLVLLSLLALQLRDQELADAVVLEVPRPRVLY